MTPDKKRMKNSFLLLFTLGVLVSGCNRNDIYIKYKTIPEGGWHSDSVYTFDVPITDISTPYNVYINIRNKADYPYQNLWLFVSELSRDSVMKTDSIECYLADDRGKWLGSGVGSVHEMPLLIKQNITFKKKGNYQYKLMQGMRDTILAGINDIGLRVEKVTKQ